MDLHTHTDNLYTDSAGKRGQNLYDKICAICGKKFDTVYKSKELCGYTCKMERVRQNSRIYMRKKNTIDKRYSTCLSDGCNMPFTQTHHEGFNKTYQLCPSHHAAITRGYASLDQVLKGWPDK